MQGFGIQTKDINQLITRIENEIKQIALNLNKNVEYLDTRLKENTEQLRIIQEEIENMKDYTADYEEAERRIMICNQRINDIYEQLNNLCGTISLEKVKATSEGHWEDKWGW